MLTLVHVYINTSKLPLREVFCAPGPSPRGVPERYLEVTCNSPYIDDRAFDRQNVDSVGFMTWYFS